MKKTTAPKRLTIHRETLLRLKSDVRAGGPPPKTRTINTGDNCTTVASLTVSCSGCV
jgi:hypothetical protein